MYKSPDEFERMLDEAGVAWERKEYPNPKAVGYVWLGNNCLWYEYTWYGGVPQMLECHSHVSPEEALRVTTSYNSYSQWRGISDAVGDAMQRAHDKAIECPEVADPLWDLDTYVNRVIDAAFDARAVGRAYMEARAREQDS